MSKWFEAEQRYKCLWCGTTDRYRHSTGCQLSHAMQEAIKSSLKYRLKLAIKKLYRRTLDSLRLPL